MIPHVFISHSGHKVGDDKMNNTESEKNSSRISSNKVKGKNPIQTYPCRKNTLSSGGVTVIVSHDTDSEIVKHKTVTNIFSNDIDNEMVEQVIRASQLTFK